MTTATKKATRRAQWAEVLRRCGGVAEPMELARTAHAMGLTDPGGPFETIYSGAGLRAVADDARRQLNAHDEEGNRGALWREEFILGDDGQTVSHEKLVQIDLAEREDWRFTVRRNAKSLLRDHKKLLRDVQWGLEKWPRERATVRKMQAEFGFDLGV